MTHTFCSLRYSAPVSDRACPFTIGYEQTRPDAVMATLKKAKVQVLVDTRAVAASRKPGFSKRQLAAIPRRTRHRLSASAKLGTPAEGRQAARSGKIEQAAGASTISTSRRMMRDRGHGRICCRSSDQAARVCLLCFERDPGHCHRSRIAEIVQERTGAKVTDLMPEPRRLDFAEAAANGAAPLQRAAPPSLRQTWTTLLRSTPIFSISLSITSPGSQ